MPSWNYTSSVFTHQLTFKNNSININGKTQAFSDSDAVAVFIKNIDTTYVSAGYGYYKLPGDTLGVTVNLDSGNVNPSYKLYYWNHTMKCQVSIQDSNQLFLNPFQKSTVLSAFGQLQKVSYPKTKYNQSEKSATINTPSIPVSGYSSSKNLQINTITGEIDLINSNPGNYTIVVNSTFCLQSTQLSIQILADSVPVKNDTSQLNLSNLIYDVLQATCNKEGSIFIKTNSIKGIKPFHYVLSNKVDNSITQSSSGIFEEVNVGIYSLTITDSSGKAVRFSQEIKVVQGEDCHNIVIRPDGKQGLQSLYISETGSAKILNRNAEVVRNMIIPAEWDGSDQQGNPVPMGDYYLFVNEAQSKIITVLR